jgi:uncharacterized membrane protein YgcG
MHAYIDSVIVSVCASVPPLLILQLRNTIPDCCPRNRAPHCASDVALLSSTATATWRTGERGSLLLVLTPSATAASSALHLPTIALFKHQNHAVARASYAARAHWRMAHLQLNAHHHSALHKHGQVLHARTVKQTRLCLFLRCSVHVSVPAIQGVHPCGAHAAVPACGRYVRACTISDRGGSGGGGGSGGDGGGGGGSGRGGGSV